MVKTLYRCEICKEVYDKQKDAEECEARSAPVPKFKMGDLVRTTDFSGSPFEATIIWVGNGHKCIWYNIKATDTERFCHGGCFSKDEDQLEKVG